MMMRSAFTVVAALGATLFVGAPASWASVSLSYDFNTLGEVDANFNKYVASGSITQANSGGIGGSGAINLGTANGVYATKKAFSIGPVGSTYVFTAFMQSVGNSGYSGMGFTSEAPSASNAATSPVYRPNDALGMSVHGGGFFFHDGATNSSGSWGQTGTVSGVNTVTAATVGDLLNNGSAVDWYKVVLTASRDSLTTFDMNMKVFPTDVNGNTLDTNGNASTTPSAEFTFNDRVATDLINAPVIYAYFNFSGTRVYNYDNFSVNLGGGASVIDPGFPVVVTNGVSATSGKLSFDGDVTSDGGQAITERGFVYDSSSGPTTSDSKVTETGTTGAYSKDSPSVADGTWYARAYATNPAGTSYGAEYQVVVSGGAGTGTVPDAVEDDGGGGGGGGDDPDSISLYFSEPFVTGSAVTDGATTETFNSYSTGACPTSITGFATLTYTAGNCTVGAQGGTSPGDSAPAIGVPLSSYVDKTLDTTFTFDNAVKYVGFWWMMGSNGNNVEFLDSSDTVIATFNVNDVITFLGSNSLVSNSDTRTVTNVGGGTYPTRHYYRTPANYTGTVESPVMNYDVDAYANEPWVYLNLYVTGTLSVSKVRFTGSNFEIDNLTVTSSDVSPTDDLVLVLENIYDDGGGGGGGGGGSPADPPTDITVTPGNGTATVGWTPASGGSGGTATSYTVTDATGLHSCTVAAPATSCQISGLDNGYPYVFSVVATNAAGDSADSSRTPAVIPTAPYSGNTLTIYFTSISPKLSAYNQSLISDFINDHSFRSLKCTGSTQGLETIVWLAKSRSANACNYAKTIKNVRTSAVISKNKGIRAPLRSVVMVGR
jgi:uncharacterized glyoxalase superfamily protein PhnB